MTDRQDQPQPQPMPQAATTATLTTSTTGVVIWAVAHYAFRGQIPPEVYGWLQLAVPTALGLLSAHVSHWRTERYRCGH
jgi:hypothetical protein